MGEVALLVVAAVWLALLGLGALVVRRELQLLRDRLDGFGHGAMDGLGVGAPAPRTPGLAADDVLLFLFGDCGSCRDIAAAVAKDPDPRRYLVVVNDGTLPGSGAAVARALPAGARRLIGPDAAAARERFRVNSAPFGMAVRGGLVAARGTVRDAGDLDTLVRIGHRDLLLPLASAGHGHP